MIRVAVDALGGDRAPEEIVAGAVAAASPEIQPTLFGPASLDPQGLVLVATSEAIAMDESAVESVRAKVDSSLVRAVRAVADGDAEAAVSAGNTGAMLAASLMHIRRLPGVHRPGIAAVIPTKRGPSVLIDAGANADARPEHLVQFAHMGAVLAEEILGVTDPQIRLLSIGEEPEKGSQLVLEAHELLARELARVRREHRGAHAARGRGRRRRCRRLHRQRRAEDHRGHDQDRARGVAERTRGVAPRQARRPADPSGSERAARAARSGHVRRRVPARAQGPRRHRPRLEFTCCDRERDPPGRTRSRASGGASACKSVSRTSAHRMNSL